MKRAVLLVWVLAVAACGPEEVGTLAVEIAYPDPQAVAGGLRGEQPPQSGKWPEPITDFRLCVSAPDMSKPKCANFNRTDYERRGKASLGGVPVGKNRRVTFQGYVFDSSASDFEVYWCGEASGLKIGSGTTRVQMFITACSNFTQTRSAMQTPRVFHSATLLPNGAVLLVGGFTTSQGTQPCSDGSCRLLEATRSIEIYDPRTGAFQSIPGLELSASRGLHAATLLGDGRILVSGGCNKLLWRDTFTSARPAFELPAEGCGEADSSAEIIDLSKPEVKILPSSLKNPRLAHAMVSVGGEAVVLGGLNSNGALMSAERFNAAESSFADFSGALQVARYGFTPVEISAGNNQARFFIWGGNHPSQPGAGVYAEIVEINTHSITSTLPSFVTNNPDRGLPVFWAGATSLGSDRVLVTGGMLADTAFNPGLTKPEVVRYYRLCDVSTGTLLAPGDDSAGNTMTIFRTLHTSTLLNRSLFKDDPSFRVLVAGGLNRTPPGSPRDFEPQDTAEFYLTWKTGESQAFETIQIKGVTVRMTAARAGHTATALSDGTVLLAGGFTNGMELSASAEIFNPTMRNLRVE